MTLLNSWERATPLTQDVAEVEPGHWEPERHLNLAVGGPYPGKGGFILCGNLLSWEGQGHGAEGIPGTEKHGQEWKVELHIVLSGWKWREKQGPNHNGAGMLSAK